MAASVTTALLLAVLWSAAPGRDYEGPTEIGEPPEPSAEVEPTAPEEDAVGSRDPAEPTYSPDVVDAPAVDPEVREIRVGTPNTQRQNPDRSGSRVERRDLEERLPRSAPDALRYEPGVYVQQTAHGQASPYVRGLTGQQTVLYFDGIRLNNSTFRQGPNQYFFTVDSHSLQSLEVVRGSASTRYGADALGGALLSTPIEPDLEESRGRVVTHGKATVRTATADGQAGGRAELSLAAKGKFAIAGGIGYRNVGQLRSGGPVVSPATGEPHNVPPAFEIDGKTQKGTGFRELTGDGRLIWQPRRRYRFTVGYYDYRQYDAPRTDKCPPPTAPQDECLTYDEQFRSLVYGAFDATEGPAAAEKARAVISYQRQHEDRVLDRGAPSTTQLTGLDNVNTLGASLRLSTKRFDLARWATLDVSYGVDNAFDWISSEAALAFEDTGISTNLSRGQYLDGATYDTFGAWTELGFTFADVLRLRAGGRGAVAHASADGDLASESAAVDQTWGTGVGGGGLAVDPVPGLSFAFNVDQGYRAPNLDDLTSRQQTGPGFQFENADLDPERSTSLELGGVVSVPWLEVDVWVFQTYIRDLIGRAARTAADCPEGDPGCAASQTQFQVANLDGRAVLRGVEGAARVRLPAGVWARATVSAARGDQPNPVRGVDAPEVVPMSRVPPVNGSGEIGWHSAYGVWLASAVRWAVLQDRLAPQDEVDARIPLGGTPGYVVFDARAGYRLDPWVSFAVVFENVADTAWRAHGSSVNGPGRGMMIEAQFGF